MITGASRGFGERIARRFWAEGASLLIAARDRERLEEVGRSLEREKKPGQKVVAQAADVSREADVDALARRALSEFPQVHILVNCAGVAGPRGAAALENWAEWKQAVEINLNGAVYTTLALLPSMKARRYGKIVNISGGGATKPLPHLSAYAASKAGVVRFTETLAEEVREYGIDVNSMAPGVLNTRMMDHFLEVEAETIGQPYLEEAARQKRDGERSFERATGLCVYLASAESDGLTGKLVSAVWDPWEDFASRREDLASTDIYTLRRIVPGDRGMKWERRAT